MQRIERYGVVVLLFMMVTFVAVALWDGGSPDKPAAAEKQASALQRPPANATQAPARNQAAQQQAGRLPLSQQPAGRSNLRPNRARNQTPVAARSGAAPAPQREPQATDKVVFTPPPRRQQTAPQQRAPQRREEPIRMEQPRWNERDERVADTRANERRFQDELREAQGRRAQQTIPAVNTAPRRSAPVQPPVAAGASTYVVKAGDTLGEISLKTLGSSKRWREIQAVNKDLDPKRLFVGATLKLPTGAKGDSALELQPQTREAAPAEPRQAPAAGNTTYTVRAGDTLSRIAQTQLGTSKRWREIVALNPKVDPDRLFVGARLRMPVGASSAARDAGRLIAQAEPQRQSRNRVR